MLKSHCRDNMLTSIGCQHDIGFDRNALAAPRRL